jgi:hypothetical protein
MPVWLPNMPVPLSSCLKSRGHKFTANIPTSIFVNKGQPKKASLSILESLDDTDILTACSDSQREQASRSIAMTDPGISKVARLEQR